MSELRSKAIEVAGKFLAHRGYEVIETGWKSERGSAVDIVAKDEDDLVFCDVSARNGFERGIPESNDWASRERREIAAAAWLSEHCDDDTLVDLPIRFDSIAMMVIGENRALVRHHINCLGFDITAGQTD